MCGIVAVQAFDNSVSIDRLQAATNSLIHRGPDHQSTWVSEKRDIGLGHTRLSIIDLETGDQPISNEDGSIHIVANGEFYDHDKIIVDLKKRGHRFRTRSDSEIALHLYEDHGIGALSRLRGEFAFVIWDSKNQLLFAARDRFGIKPLYYCQSGERLFIASEIKAILAAGVSPTWNHDTVHQVGSACSSLPADTLFHGVFSLPAGHILLSRRGQVSTRSYWDFDYPKIRTESGRRSEQEIVEGFRDKLKEAIRLRLRADVPVACYLSGGLDSCSVLGFMVEQSSTPVKAFNLTFDQPDYDESEVATEMANHCGAEYEPIPITQKDIAENFSDAIWNSETFFANGHGVSKFLLSRAVRDAGFKVVFTGEGADEILAGYPHFRQDILPREASGELSEAGRCMLADLQRKNSVSRGLLMPDESQTSASLHTVEAQLGFVPTWMRAHASVASKVFPLMDRDWLAHFGDRDGNEHFLAEFDLPRQLWGRDPLNQSLYLWSRSSLQNYILNVLGDRMEMAHSIEGRVPFLDHHLVEFMRDVPVELKISGMTEKYLLKEAAKPVLTETVYQRQKHPFLAPPSAIVPKEPLYDLTQETLRSQQMASLPFFDSSELTSLLDRLPAMSVGERTGYDPVLMLLLSIATIADRFSMNV